MQWLIQAGHSQGGTHSDIQCIIHQEWGLDCCPSFLPAPGKLSIRPPQSKNYSAVPVINVFYSLRVNSIKRKNRALYKLYNIIVLCMVGKNY